MPNGDREAIIFIYLLFQAKLLKYYENVLDRRCVN